MKPSRLEEQHSISVLGPLYPSELPGSYYALHYIVFTILNYVMLSYVGYSDILYSFPVHSILLEFYSVLFDYIMLYHNTLHNSVFCCITLHTRLQSIVFCTAIYIYTHTLSMMWSLYGLKSFCWFLFLCLKLVGPHEPPILRSCTRNPLEMPLQQQQLAFKSGEGTSSYKLVTAPHMLDMAMVCMYIYIYMNVFINMTQNTLPE